MQKTIDSVRLLSSAVCGSRYRLEILHAIANARTFTATELIAQLWKVDSPPTQSIVSTELKRLRGFDLIQRAEGDAGSKSIRLVAADTDLWDAINSLVDAA